MHDFMSFCIAQCLHYNRSHCPALADAPPRTTLSVFVYRWILCRYFTPGAHIGCQYHMHPARPPPSHYQPIYAQNSNTLRNRIQKLYIHTLTLATTVWLHFIISYFVHRELHRMGVDLVALYSTEMTTFSFNNI